MHWGPLKSSDRGMGPRGHGKRAWWEGVCGWGHEVEPGSRAWSRGRGHAGHGMEIDNRRTCGHQFTVAAGKVVAAQSATARFSYKCPKCDAKVESTTRDGRINNRRTCGHQFTVAAGKVVAAQSATARFSYECPKCKAKVASAVRDGRIDNRWKCGPTVRRAGRAKRAGMRWGPLKSSDRGMGPRGHGKRAWGEGVCGWWQPCGILGP